MELINALLFIAALVCFIIAAVGRPVVSRVNLVALGLAFFTTVYVISAVRAV